MNRSHLLFFTVAGRTCALPLAAVRQVVGMAALSPESRDGGDGTVNLHGETIPVYPVRDLLGLPGRPPLPTDVLIITHARPDCMALRVDGVQGVREGSLPADDGTTSHPGVHLAGDGTIIIHDPGALCAAEERERFSIPPDGEETAPGIERRGAMEDKEDHAAVTSDILTFRLAGREYAIETRYIREVFIIREITPVPGVPDFIAGICAVRGEIISVVDLARILSIPKQGLTDLNRVIVLSDGKMTFGILADYITDIGTISRDDIAPAEPGMTPIGEQYLLGVAEGSLILLDAAAILADPRMLVHQTRQ
jgi:chemotaxis signal transduction protein